VAESLRRGQRVIVYGTLKQKTFETKTGEKRTVFEVSVEDAGPSLRAATAKVQKESTQTRPEDEVWASSAAPVTSDSEPPF
jgi:single-strand DNA-binding protein